MLLLIMLGFVASGLLFIPRLGIEVDEAIVANGIYPHGSPWYSWRFGGVEIPVMLITYLGAVKTWMYSVLFAFVEPRPMSLRMPTLLLAAGSLWLFFALLDRTVSRRAAWIGTVLLATDSSYLLMNTVDYGPVTVQFVLKLAALVFLAKFQRSGSRAQLGAAFFLLGLAMWDKAVFSWVLFGLGVGALAVFPKEVFAELTWKNVRTAALAGIAGALPFLIYNVVRPLETFRTNAQVESLAVWGKSIILTRTMDGSVLFGFMTAFDTGTMPGASDAVVSKGVVPGERVAGRAAHESDAVDDGARGAVGRAVVGHSGAQADLIWVCRVRRNVAADGADGGRGAAAQHVILLWPFHLLMIAAAVDRLPRIAAIAATVVLCGSNLAVTNQYYAELVRNGPIDALDGCDGSAAAVSGGYAREAHLRGRLGHYRDDEFVERRPVADVLRGDGQR